MPAILSVSGSTESGYTYDDRLGEYYSFPRKYRRIIVSGETVLFYTGTRNYPDAEPTSYLGMAIVGAIEETEKCSKTGQPILLCRFHAFTRFPKPVYFKSGDAYLEEAANNHKKPSLHFSNGVRRISMGELFNIVKMSGL